jgi:hypothetical protein
VQREVTVVGSEFRAGVVAEFELMAVQARHAWFEELANRKKVATFGIETFIVINLVSLLGHEQ